MRETRKSVFKLSRYANQEVFRQRRVGYSIVSSMKLYTKNTPKILEQLKKGEIDRISFALGGFTDEVLKEMFQLGIIDLFVELFSDKRADNAFIPSQALLVLAQYEPMSANTRRKNS